MIDRNHLPAVTVVIAAFNEELHIPRLLRSLERQTLMPREIIVVDDGSTDETAACAARSGAAVTRVPHRGPARARNIGASLAFGEILIFLDGDMACAPHFLEALVAPIVNGSAIGTFSKDIFIGNPENRWARAYARIRRLAFPRLLPNSFPDRWANYRAVRRDRFLAVGGYDDVGYGEDMTLAPKLGELARYAPGAVCYHFNPATLREIFENGRWIGRGYDIEEVRHPWRDNFLICALLRGIAEARDGHGHSIVAARVAYHLGVTLGLIHRSFAPARHWK